MTMSFGFINLLPHSLLSTIISQLPFKEAVRTSVLSKNWLNIYKSTTNMEFNELFFVKLDEPNAEIKEAQRKAFLDFIALWIVNHEGTMIDKFSLMLSMPQNVGDVIEKCIAFATQHGVKDLELDFSDPNWNADHSYYEDFDALCQLPPRVYDYTKLESLKLYSCGFVDTKLVNFHSLKEVSLGWMEVTLFAIKAMLMNCKMLESLCFKKCWSYDDFDLGEDPVLGLKKLVLDKCRFVFEVFKVNAPNLKVFRYCGLMNFFIMEIYSTSMEEADLDFSPEYGFEDHGPFLYHLVDGLKTVSVLSVCCYLLQVIPSGGEPLRMQRDLDVRHLIMKTALHENEFLGITFMLNSCPMLEYLTIELCYEKFLLDYEAPFEFDRVNFWINNVGGYKCLSSSLKVVEFNGFKGTKNELLVLNYLMNWGEVLERISINILKGFEYEDDEWDSDGGDVNKMESCRREKAELLLTAPRASRKLEISIF